MTLTAGVTRSAAVGVPEGAPETPTFEQIYERHAQTVARWAARLGGPGVDVEEITQEVFMVVNRHLGDFRHESRVSTWLFGITAKVTANDRRRRKLRRFWVRPGARVDDRPAATATPLEELEQRERRALFYAALDALGERHRRALVLFELEELTIADIAELMALRPGNVRVLLHRARAAFLKEMTARELRQALGTGPAKEAGP